MVAFIPVLHDGDLLGQRQRSRLNGGGLVEIQQIVARDIQRFGRLVCGRNRSSQAGFLNRGSFFNRLGFLNG